MIAGMVAAMPSWKYGARAARPRMFGVLNCEEDFTSQTQNRFQGTPVRAKRAESIDVTDAGVEQHRGRVDSADEAAR